MAKRGSFILVFLILVLIAAANIYTYSRETKMGLSGYSFLEIGDKIKKLDFSTIAFIIQWILILAVVLIFYVKFLRRKKKEDKKSVKLEVRRRTDGKSTTDFDDLYELLKEKKSLKLPAISGTFKIDKEKALEWCRILEEHNLVSIMYPPFSEPEVTIK